MVRGELRERKVERLMNVAEVERRLQEAVANGDILGLSLAVIEGGQIVFADGYGVTAVGEAGLPVDADTLFPFGSIGKVLCATLVMRLVEQGLLELDRPLLEYLPRLSFSDEAYGRQLTLRHVLSHTTGLPAAGRYYGPRGEKALQQVVQTEVPYYAFLTEPGTLHLYANTVYCIAGYAAEVVAGVPYDDLVRQLVLKPLQMAATTFHPPPPSSGRVALPHEEDGGALHPTSRLPANDAGHPSSFAYGTATDLAQLAIAHLEQGTYQGRHFLSQQSLAEVHREQASCHIAGASHPLAHISDGYGLGIQTGDYLGHRVLRHGGMTLSCNCFFELLPESRSGFVLLTNAGEEAPLMELVTFLYDRLLGLPHRGIVPLKEPAPFEAPEERQKWPLYEGTYLNVEWGRLAQVRLEGDALLLAHDGEARPLTPIAPGRYYAVTASGARLPLAFLTGDSEPSQHIVLARMPYHRYTVEQVTGEKTVWPAFAGSYRDPFNTDDDETLRLRYEDGRLYLRERNGEEMPCQPLGVRAFRCDLGFFELEVDGADATPLLVWGKATRYRRI
jgi:CubicO group peptidase (beta-lactamase class C family)